MPVKVLGNQIKRNKLHRCQPSASPFHLLPCKVLGHLFLTHFDEQLVDAWCEDGILYVTKPEGWGYIEDMTYDGGGELHAFDYPLFYRNIRNNAVDRVEAYFEDRLNSSLALQVIHCGPT